MPERAGHGASRAERGGGTDHFATHPAFAALICREVAALVPRPRTILEPGCGAGTFLRPIRTQWPTAILHGLEIREDLATYAAAHGFDVALADVLQERLGRYDLVLGNPPFKYADAFVPLLLGRLNPGGRLGLLLRLNFLAGQERYEALWSKHPPEEVWPFPARPGFDAAGSTDATDYALVVWRAEPVPVGATRLRWLDNRSVQVRWNGSRATDTRAAILDPTHPDVAVPQFERPTRQVLTPALVMAEWAERKALEVAAEAA